MIDLVRVRREGGGYVAAWGQRSRRCAVGRGGIAEKMREGDGITPAGLWPLRRVLYRSDRQHILKTAFPLTAIARGDGWCDAPTDVSYNCPVKLPYKSSAEELWRSDALYDIVVVVGYNDAPIVAGKGSAIFLHVAAEDFAHTEGCVALTKEDISTLLGEISSNTKILIESS